MLGLTAPAPDTNLNNKTREWATRAVQDVRSASLIAERLREAGALSVARRRKRGSLVYSLVGRTTDGLVEFERRGNRFVCIEARVFRNYFGD